MPRPKKTQPPSASSVAMDTDDTAEASHAPPECPLDAAPEPEPEPDRDPESVDHPADFVTDRVPMIVQRHRRSMVAAEKHFEKVKRAWKRKKNTYSDGSKYSSWEFPAVVKRVGRRLMEADIDLGEAWAEYIQCRDRWVRWRTYSALMLAQDRHVRGHGSIDPVLERFYERALERVTQPCPRPSWKLCFEGLAHNIWDWNASHFGLSISHGLMHSDQLRDPSIDPNETEWERRRRAKAEAEKQPEGSSSDSG